MAATDSTAAELWVLETACGLVDRSERGKLALTGTEAKSYLTGQVTNDIEALEPGSGCYAAFLTHKGKMQGDLRILNLGHELLLDTERSALQALFNLIRRSTIGFDAELHKRTLERGLLSLIGPQARSVAGAEALPDREHANTVVDIDGTTAVAVVTDVGIDIVCDGADTGALRDALVARGAVVVDEAVAECLRIARGRPRYGIDLDDTTIPQEAGLNERAVSFTKGCYVGQETVARLHYKGKPNRHLRGLRLSAAAATGDPLTLGEREVGRVGSIALHPTLGPIALAIVRREAAVGDELVVGTGETTATVVELPFA
jgi:folate-binding protein YgfZ